MFSMFKWNLLYFNLCPCAPCPFTEKSLAPSSLLPPPRQVFMDIDRIALSLLFSWLSKPKSLLIKCQMLQSLHCFHSSLLSLFQCVHVSLILGSPTQHSRRVSPELTSLNLMAVLYLPQINRPCCKGAPLAYVQLFEHQGLQNLLCKAAF